MHAGILSCPPETPVREVAHLMARQRVHAVAVANVAGDGRPWGVVSASDVAAAAAAGGEPTAGEVAAAELLTIGAHEPLYRAAQLFTEHQVSHLVVVDETYGVPVGVLSTLDLARAYAGPSPAPRTIVVALDPEWDEAGRDAVGLGAFLAAIDDAHLEFATVIDPGESGWPEDPTSVARRLRHHVRRSGLLADDAAIRVHVVPDHATPRALHDVATKFGARIVVAGAPHTGPVGRIVPGSAAERLLAIADCPVAFAPRDFASLDREARLAVVGVGYVNSADGRAALRHAVRLAARTGAALEVIEVVSPGDADALVVARERLDEVVAALPGRVTATANVVCGHAADALAAASRDLDALLIGSRGFGPLHSVLAGGMSGRVIREAACPVLVVPARR